MNRRGFLGLLGAVPLAGAVPRAVSAPRRVSVRGLSTAAYVSRRAPVDLDLSTVVPGSLVICKDCAATTTATFRFYGTAAPAVGNWVRITVAGEPVFVGQILRVTRTICWDALSYFDVWADSEGLRR
jgi:hypothetical protein